MQNVMVERSSFPSHLVIKPKDLGRLLGHFQSSLQEITLIATEPVSTDMDPDSEAKAIELKSYIDPARGKVATLYLTSSHSGARSRSSKFDFFSGLVFVQFENFLTINQTEATEWHVQLYGTYFMRDNAC